MAGDEPEVGDKASWSWNGSNPSGEVAEKKTEGEVSIESKRGNTIKKSAQPDDPAIHLSRPGNDVVKNQSELHVDEKADEKADENKGGDDAPEGAQDDDEEAEKETEEEEDKPNGETSTAKPKTANKRKATDDGGADKKRGRPKGAAKKEKVEKPAKEKKEKPVKEKKEKPVKEKAETNGEKKARGRPKGPPKPEKEKKARKQKPEKPKAPATGVGKRTRSGGK